MRNNSRERPGRETQLRVKWYYLQWVRAEALSKVLLKIQNKPVGHDSGRSEVSI
jgi:hypothetical protein